MHQIIAAIQWDVDPVMFSIGGFEIRWYGAFFGLAFLLGYQILTKMIKTDGADPKLVDKALLYVMIGAVVGARLGHILFYGPYWDEFDEAGRLISEGYMDHPLSWFNIREGGLASHGGLLGILIMSVLLVRNVRKKFDVNFWWWILDRIAIVGILGGALIRFGNLMNHEIVGVPTGSDYGFIFTRFSEGFGVAPMPRHPAQLYEAVAYLLIFGFLAYLFFRTKSKLQPGKIAGWFMILVFTARFFIEFVKVQQTHLVDDPSLKTGQWLSIPFVLIGLYLVFRNNKAEVQFPTAPSTA